MNYKAIVSFKSKCFFLHGRMFVNYHHPEAFVTSNVKKVNFLYDVEINHFSVEVHTKNSVYLITRVPHEVIVELTEGLKNLQLETHTA